MFILILLLLAYLLGIIDSIDIISITDPFDVAIAKIYMAAKLRLRHQRDKRIRKSCLFTKF